tara:strand:+ start:675 stop:854 length:180 start_codon:yes stop_codon:yes gene_type:complete
MTNNTTNTATVTITKKNLCTGKSDIGPVKANGKFTVNIVNVDGTIWKTVRTDKVKGIRK